MKKIWKILIAVFVVTALAVTIIACDNKNRTVAEAKAAALNAVGATEADAEYAVTHTTAEGNVAVEFVIDGVKYNAVVSGSNKLLSFEINDRPVEISSIPTVPTKEGAFISKSEAKAIALADAGIAEGITVYADVDWDYCDGHYMYDVEFTAPDGVKYEYEIIAETGAIHKKEVDDVTVITPTVDGKTFITVEEAKAIALATAGTAEGTFKQVSFDYDHGAYVYDVELIVGNKEYEYEINAETGVVIKTDEDVFVGIGTEEEINKAKEIALAHAGLTADAVTFTDVEVDLEWGVKVYKLEFVSGNYEYEYEINAETGKIVDVDKEIKEIK